MSLRGTKLAAAAARTAAGGLGGAWEACAAPAAAPTVRDPAMCDKEGLDEECMLQCLRVQEGMES